MKKSKKVKRAKKAMEYLTNSPEVLGAIKDCFHLYDDKKKDIKKFVRKMLKKYRRHLEEGSCTTVDIIEERYQNAQKRKKHELDELAEMAQNEQ